MKRQMGTGLIALLAIMTAVACSIDDFIDYGGVIGVDDGASEGAFKSQRVDGSQDVRIELKTGAAITIPKDAVETTVEIGMQRPADEKAISLVKSLKDYQAIVSAPYVLTPHGTKFRAPVSIEIPVTKQTDKKLVVAWLENESDKTWKKLGAPVVKDGVAKLDIDHFSVVILLEEDRANLANDEDGADSDAGSVASGNGAPLDGGANDVPASGVDAGRATAFGFDAGSATNSAPAMTLDASFPIFDKDAGAFPFPFGDASTATSADAAIPVVNDASASPVDSGADSAANDGGKGPAEAGADAAGNDAG